MTFRFVPTCSVELRITVNNEIRIFSLKIENFDEFAQFQQSRIVIIIST